MQEQQIKEAYESLPQIVKDAIRDSHWAEEVGRIGKKYNLRIDQTAVIEDQVTLIMLGFVSVNDFIKTMPDDVGVSNKDIQKGIIEDLEKNIFAKIRQALVEKTETLSSSENIATADNQNSQSMVTTPAQTSIVESRDEILSQIENPIKTETQVVKTASPIPTPPAPVITAPITPTQPKIVKIDPYREPLE
jgi:hypothetical protein